MRTPAPRIDSHLTFRFAFALAALALLLAPVAARSGEHRTTTRSTTSGYFYSDEDSHFGWAIFDPKEGNVTGSADGDDYSSMHRALDDEDRTVFWFKIDDDHYVVRDPEIVARVEEMTRPMRELGKKQGELGRRQGALGREQGKLGAEQGRLGRRQAVLSQRLARFAVEDASDGGDSHRAERRAIERELEELSARMGELGAQQGELGAKQAPLGEQQGELGRQQGELTRKVSADLRKVAEEALRDGKAQRLGARRRGTI